MASIIMHPHEKTSFNINEYLDIQLVKIVQVIEIKHGDDTVSIFFNSKNEIDSFLGTIQTEIYAYQREKE